MQHFTSSVPFRRQPRTARVQLAEKKFHLLFLFAKLIKLLVVSEKCVYKKLAATPIRTYRYYYHNNSIYNDLKQNKVYPTRTCAFPPQTSSRMARNIYKDIQEDC